MAQSSSLTRVEWADHPNVQIIALNGHINGPNISDTQKLHSVGVT